MPSRSARLARIVAQWLDDKYLDPLVGLFIPALGDLVTTLAGVAVVAAAWRDGVRPAILARMLLNLAIDGLLGAVPIVGDVFDFVFKAHRKNATLLEARDTGPAKIGDYVVLFFSATAVLCALALPVAALIWLIIAAWGSFP